MQVKHKSLRQKLIALIVSLSIFVAAFSFVRLSATPIAEADETTAFAPTSVSVTNGDFSETSGDMPSTPNSWTAATLGETPEGSTVDGVVDLDPAVFNAADNGSISTNLEKYKLDRYDEFKNGNIPLSPFGRGNNNYESSDSNALMINSNGSRVAFGYTSANMSLSANSYYKISAWVKTGVFDSSDEKSGAYVKVNGLKNPLVFAGIETDTMTAPTQANNYGWKEYSFFIETSTMSDSSISISLQLGDYYEYEKNGKTNSTIVTTSGYAFFDHITAYQYAPDVFFDEAAECNTMRSFEYGDSKERKYYTNAEGNALFYSENDSEYLAIKSSANGADAGGKTAGVIMRESEVGFASEEIGSFDNGMKGWQAADNSHGNFNVGIFDGLNEDLGIKNTVPFSPNGTNDNILVFGSYDASNSESHPYSSAHFGYVTDYFTVPRYKNYRISVWVKTENGKVASAAISGFDYRGPNNDASDVQNYGKGQLRVESEISEGNADNASRNGWKELAFYLKGSSYADYAVRLELWLGSASEEAAGVAMFDNIRIEEITAKEYTDYSGGGKSVTFDRSETNGAIANGEFNNIEEYDDPTLLFTPASWTRQSAGEDGTTGMSTVVPDADYNNWFVGGVISSDAKTFNYERPDGTIVSGNANPDKLSENTLPSNLLFMRADGNTGVGGDLLAKGGVAVGYKSSSFSISSSSVQRIDIVLKAENIGGYGANLVLKQGTNVIATIEKIKDTADYVTYSFYVQTGDADISEAYVEIWLGLYDRKNNTNKLATGTLYVESVAINDLSSGEDALESARMEFAEQAENYQRMMDTKSDVEFATYSTLKDDFTAFDRYSDDFVKTPYNWSKSSINANDGDSAVVYGIFDGSNVNGSNDPEGSGDNHKGVYVPDDYKHLGAINRHSMLIRNVSPASSKIKANMSYHLASGSYYTITVKAKVDIPEAQSETRPNYKGAYIGIVDSEYAISDIKTTATVTGIYDDANDDGYYKDFVFYVRTAGELASEDDDSSSSSSSSNTADTVVSLEFGIGGATNDEWAVGALMINSIAVEQCSNIDFEEARDKIDTVGAMASKYIAIADYGTDDSDEEEDDTPDTSVNTGDNWYVYMSIIFAVVLIIVLIAVAVRYFAIKKRREGGAAEGAPSYDRERTLVRQHNSREGLIDENAKSSDTYEMFDEDEEDRLEAAQLERELMSEETEEVEAEEGSPADADTASETEESGEVAEETSTEETTETVAEETATEESGEATEANAEGAPVEEVSETEEEYKYSEEIVDFTPSEEKKKELEAKRAAAEAAKAEKEAAKKRAEEERAKLDAAKREANRHYNDWDKFDE